MEVGQWAKANPHHVRIYMLTHKFSEFFLILLINRQTDTSLDSPHNLISQPIELILGFQRYCRYMQPTLIYNGRTIS